MIICTPASSRAIPRPRRSRGRAARVLLALLAAAMLPALGATPALATGPTWSPFEDLTTPKFDDFAEAPQVAVDAEGDVIAVWSEENESKPTQIVADVRPAATGTWETPVVISSLEPTDTPQLAIDAAGEAVVVWRVAVPGPGYAVTVATGNPLKDEWKAPVAVSGPLDATPEEKVAVSATGDAVVTWFHEGPPREAEVARGSTQGAWKPAEAVTGSSGETDGYAAAVDDAGDVVVGWGRYNGVSETTEANSYVPGTGWLTAAAISPAGADAEPPVIGSDAGGDVVAAWRNVGENAIEAAAGDAGSGTWKAPVTVSEKHIQPQDLTLAVNAHGSAVLAWRAEDPSPDVVQAATGSALSGEWQSAVTLGKGTLARYDPSAAVDPQGDTLVSWYDEQTETFEAAAEDVGQSSFSASTEFSEESDGIEEAQVAFGGHGIGAAVWANGDEDGGDEVFVQSSIFTGTPSIGVVTGPAEAVGETSATVTGAVYPKGNLVTECEFEYGTTPSLGHHVSCEQSPGNGEGRVAVSALLSSLPQGTTYYYRLEAGNVEEDTAEGEVRNFTTAVEKKTVIAPVETKSEPPPAPPITEASRALACSTAQVALIDVLPNSNHVLITGAAREVLAGKKVSIKLLSTGKVVATPTVNAAGTFTATVPLPPSKVRYSNATRYQASIGGLKSLALKLERRANFVHVTVSGDRVLILGKVSGKFRVGAPVHITLRVTCESYETVATVKLTRAGTFSANVPAPTGAVSQIALYRASTTVLEGTHPEPTFTLPLPPDSGSS